MKKYYHPGGVILSHDVILSLTKDESWFDRLTMTLAYKIATLLTTLVFLLGLISCKKDITYREKPMPELVIDATESRLAAPVFHLSRDTVYILGVNLTVQNGQALEIEAGTLIKVRNGLRIVVAPGGSISAEGTAAAPVVFTVDAPKGTQGLTFPLPSKKWNGIELNQDATVNAGTIKMQYVRIEFAGDQDAYTYADYPPLGLKHIKNDAILHHIQVSYCTHFEVPQYKISGGDFNASYLVSYAASGPDFEITDGYTGKLQFLLAQRNAFFPISDIYDNSYGNQRPLSNTTIPFLSGINIMGGRTFPVISNATLLGPGNGDYVTERYFDSSDTYSGTFPRGAFYVGDSAGFQVRNSAFIGYPMGNVWVEDAASAIPLVNDISGITHTAFHSYNPSWAFYLNRWAYPPYKSEDLKAFLLKPKYGNSIATDFEGFQLKDPFNFLGTPDPLPQTGSSLLSGADFNDPHYSDAFFEKVSFIGAIGTTDWLQGWTNFTPLQTQYN